ncbi:NADH-quinone oxidoreductase subunit A [Escherichia coli]|nr:NADH-quinone oxidoreductase subunit A [Escherichia coli]
MEKISHSLINISIHFSISLIIATILIILNLSLKQNFISKKRNKSNVECGFDSITKIELKFSNQFFIIAIIFLIFDIELIILMPLPISSINTITLIILITIIILLTFSLIIE